MVCKISQPKNGLCENGPWLRNNFAAPKHRCENRLLLRNDFITSYPPSAKIFAAAKRPFGTRVPFRSVVPSFHSCEMLRKCCRNALLYEIHPPLRNYPPAAKMKSVPWYPFKRYKFHFSYSNRSFVLQKGTKRSQARAPSRLPFPPSE